MATLCCASLACAGGSTAPARDVGTGGDRHASREADPGCAPGQPVLLGDVLNARDLGGTPLRQGSVACGVIVRGAHLGSLGAVGCEALHALGVRTIIDLRTAEERAAQPDAACAQQDARVVLAPMPIPYTLSPADYLADLGTTPALRAVFEVLGQAASYPIYLHCTYGRDRTGVVTALILLALGASRATVVAEYERTAAAGLVIAPASLAAVLDAIDRSGGIDAHLLGLGVDASALATLRARAAAGGP